MKTEAIELINVFLLSRVRERMNVCVDHDIVTTRQVLQHILIVQIESDRQAIGGRCVEKQDDAVAQRCRRRAGGVGSIPRIVDRIEADVA